MAAAQSPFPHRTHHAIIPPMDITIHGLIFTIPPECLASPGDRCTEHSAARLELTRRSNLRNNFSRKVQATDLTQPGAETALRALFAEYEAGYNFTPQPPRATPDAVMLEATALARQELLTRARAANIEPTPADIESGVLDLIRRNSRFITEAAKRVAAQRKLSQRLLAEP